MKDRLIADKNNREFSITELAVVVANPIFTRLGPAAQAGPLSVTPHSGGSPQTVTVTTAGRITVP